MSVRAPGHRDLTPLRVATSADGVDARQRFTKLGAELLAEAQQVKNPALMVATDRPEYPAVILMLPGAERGMRLNIFVTLGHVGEPGSLNNYPLDIEVNGGSPQLTWTPGQPVQLKGWFPKGANGEPDLRFTPGAPTDPGLCRVLEKLEPLVAEAPFNQSPEQQAFRSMLEELFELARLA